LENPYPNNVFREWVKHKVSSSYAARELDFGDMDEDGDLDIAIADYAKNRIVWFEGGGATLQGNWTAHVIDKSDIYLKWVHDVKLADIDGDGKLDVLVAVAGSNVFLCYFRSW
jgi:hypothetical protein